MDLMDKIANVSKSERDFLLNLKTLEQDRPLRIETRNNEAINFEGFERLLKLSTRLKFAFTNWTAYENLLY